MAIGDSNNIVTRVKALIPTRWFSYSNSPNYGAILGGLADMSAWCYNWIGYARSQIRLATVYGLWLDIYAFDYVQTFLVRNGLPDSIFRAVLQATILQERVTRKGMTSVITTVTGTPPKIFEPWNTGDTGAYSSSNPAGFKCGQCAYGVGNGGYGSMQLPGQVFMTVYPGGPQGIANVAGYGNNIAGYGVGKQEYAGPLVEQPQTPIATVNQVIDQTKPTGTLMWIQIGNSAKPRQSIGGLIPSYL